jgi:hypothetical protein
VTGVSATTNGARSADSELGHHTIRSFANLKVMVSYFLKKVQIDMVCAEQLRI